MKVKVGQWKPKKFVRTRDNVIDEVKMFITDKNKNRNDRIIKAIILKNSKFYSIKHVNLLPYMIVKTADTPQELIEVKDIIILKKGSIVPINNFNDLTYAKTLFCRGVVAKILTPNSNGGYDLQWEANDEKITRLI